MKTNLLLTYLRVSLIFYFLFLNFFTKAQDVVFSEDFNTSAGSTYTITNGPIGTNNLWSMNRSGADFGGGIHLGNLNLSNDGSGAANQSGWIFASTQTSGFASPYNQTLLANSGLLTWTFNMRQTQSNPSGFAAGGYGAAFILAGSNGTTNLSGTGYAVMLGNSGTTDPIRLVRYNAGIRNFTSLLTSNTTGLTDFGTQFLSVKVTYNPVNSTWQLFVRNDGTTAFQDPSGNGLTLQGSVVNNTYANTPLSLIGGFWNAGTATSQRAFFDNVKVTIAKPTLINLTPSSAIAGTGAFSLGLTGTNFTPSSVVRWNGSNRTTTYISPTQLTAAIAATDLQLPGDFPITVANGLSISNSQIFEVDPAGVPNLILSTNSLAAFSTTSGTASGFLSYTISGENLTANAVVTAPTNFELSSNGGVSYADNLTLIRNGLQLTGQPITIRCRVKASAPSGNYSGSISHTTTNGVSKFVAVSGKVIAAQPTVQTTAVVFTNVTSTSYTIQFTAGNGANRMVVMRAGGAVNSAPVDGVTYTATASFGTGSQLGTGNFVVYRGSGSSVNVTNLSPATTYHVAIYEYNGGVELENYLTTTPALGNRTTLNAPVGWQIGAVNTVNTINFDTSVDGVNAEAFQGDGFSTIATSGLLNSNAWAINGFSSGNLGFGINSAEDSDFDRGTSDVPGSDGGIYAYEVAPDNFSLGLQSAPGDFTPGNVTLRFQNQTGSALNSINIGYTVYVYNNQPSSSSLNFSYSADNSSYTQVPGLSVVSTETVDVTPTWKAYYRVVTLTGLSIPTNNYYYLRWNGATVSGATNFDGFAIDDIVMVANPTTTFVPFSGNAESFVLQGNARINGATSIANEITFNGGRLDFSNQSLTLSGSINNTTDQGLRGNNGSSLIVNSSVNNSLSFDQTTVGTTNVLNSLEINTTNSNTTTLVNPIVLNGSLAIAENQSFNLGTNALTGSVNTITNNGTLFTQNTTASPLPSGRNWGGMGTVHYNAAASGQTVVSGTYENLTLSSTGGSVASDAFTVNKVLNLPSANPSATLGSLSMGSFTLTMGVLASHNGIGDVTGVITRNSIVPNVNYSFGHKDTSIIFPNVGTLPTSMSLKVNIGAAPSWRAGAILREYDFIQTGGSGTKAIIRARYLDSELNGNVENKLVDWANLTTVPAILEQGRSNFNITENWVELTNVNVGVFFTPNFGDVLLTLDQSEAEMLVWNGSVSTSWTTAANWTPNATPSDNTSVLIPNATTTTFDPELNPTVLLGKITIEAGGILNSPTNAQFTINGSAGAWINNGTFNPGIGTSRVIFTNADATISGSTTFNNVRINTNAGLRPVSGAVMDIGGEFVNLGDLYSGPISNTIIYSGTNQTLAIPTGALSAYNNLIINGTGAIFPSSLNISGNLTLNQPVDFSGKALVMNGVATQTIGGTVSPVFSNLTLNNSFGEVALNTSATVNGTLSLTQGILDIGNYNLTVGTNPIAGSFSTSNMIITSGTGKVRRNFEQIDSYTFPIGERTIGGLHYTPITATISSGTFSNAYIGFSVVNAVHPNNSSLTNSLSRYWEMEHSGITSGIISVVANYETNDVIGTESTIIGALLQGTYNQFSNPWITFDNLGSSQIVIDDATLETNSPMIISGIEGTVLDVSISGFGSFCIDADIELIANVQGGTPPYSYSWSESLGNEVTATPQSTTPSTVMYEVTVTDNNGIEITASAEVTILPTTEGGTLTSQNICAASEPEMLVLVGSVGTIIYWESDTDISFASPTNYSVTGTVLFPDVVGPLTETTYFRAVLQDAGCDVVYSNIATISFTSTTWNGTSWSNGVPNPSSFVLFTGNYSSTGDLYACSMVVQSPAIVTVNPTHTFYLSKELTVETGAQYILENNANLIQIDDVDNTGSIVVKRFTSNEVRRLDYNLWSAPVSGQNLLAFSPQTVANRFYEYNPSTNIYTMVTPTITTFSQAKGYLIRMPNNFTTWPGQWLGTFSGIPNNGNYNVAVTPETFNAVGNPYPSTIDADLFISENNIDEPLYFWRKVNNSENSSYATYTTAGGVENAGGGSAIVPNGILQVGQGFIVKATSSNLVFTNSMRLGNTDNQFLRSSNLETENFERHRVWLNMSNPSGDMGQLMVAYMTGATHSIDPTIDGKYINDSANYFSTVLDDEAYIIQGRSLPFTSTDVVPLVFGSTQSGTFTISLAQFDGLFEDSSVGIFIKDNQTGITHDIRMSSYSFESASGVHNARFELVFQDTLSDDDYLFNNEITVYASQKVLHINTYNQEIQNIKVYDISGRLIFTQSNINKNEFSTPFYQVADQIVLVQVTTINGTITKKIFLL